MHFVTVKCVYGPLAKDVEGLVEAFKAFSTPLMCELDPSVPPLPFNEKVSYWKNSVYHNPVHNYYFRVLILC